MLKLLDVKKEYQTPGGCFFALDGVSLCVEEGEFVAIVGKSGSGKSTLLNMIGTLDSVTSGSILLDGQDIATMKGKQLAEVRNQSIGFVFQRFNLEPEYTVYQNVELPLVISGSTKNEQKVQAVLEQLDLTSKAKLKTKLLSGGEQQRVAIARAIINDPKLILADEPCGNLDTTNSNIVMSILQALNQQGKTIILVTHDQEDARKAQRIVTLSNGRIISDEKISTADI